MSSDVSDFLVGLVNVKARALLHDPPNKMCVLPGHERVAEEFRGAVLSGVEPLRFGLGRELGEVVRRADVMASSFDRWLINAIYAAYTGGEVAGVARYYRLHNILVPSASVELRCQADDALKSVARELNDILKGVAEGGALLAYTTLYFALETLWYSHGLNPSLADTRTPTHTVFDHLYATASILNTTIHGGEPRGFLALIDIPGVQKFVAAARKAGDFWAGSWLLSQLMWGILRRLVDEYGPDVVITPTLRLNPYLYVHLMDRISSLSGNKREEVKSSLCKHYTRLLQALGWKPILERLGGNPDSICEDREKRRKLEETLRLIPLIPATALVILPPYARDVEKLDIQSVRERIYNYYKEAWREIVKSIESKLEEKLKSKGGSGGGLREEEVLLGLLGYIKDIVELPPVGLRVAIVDIGEFYGRLRDCLVHRDRGACSYLNVEVGLGDRLVEEVKGLDLARAAEYLLWHFMVTTGLQRALLAEETPIPAPRPFWTLDTTTGELKPVGDYTSLTLRSGEDWIPCSLCLEEPAILHPPKVWRKEDERVVEDFKDEWVKRLKEFLEKRLSKTINESDLRLILRRILRPGEALGPYCLLKRILYEAYKEELREYFGVVSTDDLALIKLDKALASIAEKDRGFKAELENKLKSLCSTLNPLVLFMFQELGREILPAGLPKTHRDIIMAMESCGGRSYEAFRSELGRALEEVCSEVCKSNPDVLLDFAKTLFADREGSVGEVWRVKAPTPLDCSRLAKLCSVRTKYSIVKGDGDDIGKILSGDISVLGLTVGCYTELLLDSLKRECVGCDERLFEAYRKAVSIAKLVTGSDSTLILSPTLSSTISMALQVTALRDIASIQLGDGFPVYVGGDDVLALLPLEVWPSVVSSLRENFWGTKGKLFHTATLDDGKYEVVIAQALPVGRSFSVRVAELMDVMSAEITRAVDLLEDVAKRASWREAGGGAESRKDSLVVSDSRSRVTAVLPLSLRYSLQRQLVSRELSETLAKLMLAVNLGVLAANTPEDLDRALMDPAVGERLSVDKLGTGAFAKLFEHIMRRNVGARDPAVAMQVLFTKLYCQGLLYKLVGSRGLTLAEELIEYVRAARGWI